MSNDIFKTLGVVDTMENFLSRIRPPEHYRPKLDIGYTIEGQSVYVSEIRPQWDQPEIIRAYPIAKATFIKAKNHWKVYWIRADLKWYSYTPKPTVKTISAFTKLIEEDTHHCFWG